MTTYEDFVRLAKESVAKEEYTKALEYYQKAHNLCSGFRDKATAAKILSSMGDTYKILEDFNAAILYYKQSSAIYDELRDYGNKGIVLSMLALLYGDMGNSKKAMEYLHQALQFIGDTHHKGLMGKLNFRLGCGYVAENRFVDARAYAIGALKIFRDLNDMPSMINAMTLMARIESSIGNDATARELLHESIKLANGIADEGFKQMHLYNVGIEYIRIKEYFLAKQFLQKSLDLCNSLGLWQGEALVQKAYADIYTETEDFPQALAQQRRLIDLYEQRLTIADPTFKLPNTFRV